MPGPSKKPETSEEEVSDNETKELYLPNLGNLTISPNLPNSEETPEEAETPSDVNTPNMKSVRMESSSTEEQEGWNTWRKHQSRKKRRNPQEKVNKPDRAEP